MKKYIMLIFAVLAIASCDSNENLVQQRGEAIVPILASVTPETPMFIDLDKDSVVFSALCSKGDSASKAAIQVTYQTKKAIVKEIRLTKDTAEYTLKATEILAALKLTKSEIALGESFVINIVTSNNGVSTISPAAFVIKLPCEYDANMNHGSYAVLAPDWNINSTVTIEADANNPNVVYIKGLAEADGLVSNGNSMKITIDPVTFKVTGEKTVLAANCGGWGASYLQYTGYAYTVISGLYGSCEGSYTIVFNISTDQEDFGDYKFTFTK